VSFLGHLHPLVVHLPIGGLVLLGVLELLSGVTRWTEAAQNSRWTLVFVCLTSLSAAACGWMLAQADGYDSRLLKWHQVTGLAFAGVSLITLLLHYFERTRAYRVSLVLSLLLLAVTGHLGGSITHGRDFLTRYAPAPIREFFCDPESRTGPKAPTLPSMQRPVFAGVIQPILRQRCSECHGAEKHKADLRLDTLKGLLRGGQDGPVIKAGEARKSPLIQCMISALDADGHMPPEDQPQPTHEEITLIEWWINKEAPESAKVIDLKPDPEIQQLVERISNRHQFAK
jgi:uncharacterized membrane protein